MSQTSIFAKLREQAEQRKGAGGAQIKSEIDLSELDLTDAQRLMEELQIYQVELEIQNDELREAQHELESARDRYAELYHTAPVGYLTLNRNGIILEANETCADMLLMRRPRLIKRPFSFFIDRVDLEAYANYMRDLFSNAALGEVKAVEIRVKLVDGTVRHTSLTGSVENSNRFDSLVCRLVVLDIEERKQMERTQELLQTAVEAGADGIAISDLRERGFPVLYVNSQMASLVDKSTSSLLNQSWHCLYEEMFGADVLLRLEEGIASGEQFEMTVQAPAVQSSWFEMLLYPLHDSFGRVAYCVHVLRDVSERVRAEEAVRRNHHLDTVSELVSGFTSEFDELLTKANSQASVALMLAAESDPTKSYLAETIKMIDEAANLVRQIQAYTGSAGGEAAEWNLNQLVTDTVALAKHSMPTFISLSLQLCEQSLFINAKRGQIQQIILNLLLNGWEAIDAKGQVTIEVGMWNEEANILWVHRPTLPEHIAYLTVRNNGSTINYPLTTLFDPFFTTKEAGRGFGLAATLGAVRANGGAIGARSDSDSTAFTVLLPLHAEP